LFITKFIHSIKLQKDQTSSISKIQSIRDLKNRSSKFDAKSQKKCKFSFFLLIHLELVVNEDQ